MRPNFIQNTRRIASVASITALAALMAACAAPLPPDQPYSTSSSYPTTYPNQPSNYVEYGRVSNIEILQSAERGRTSGAGAVIGAVAGGVLGHAIGSGGGRDLATAAGAVGGAIAGNGLESRNRSTTREIYRVSIQIDNGPYRAFDVDTASNLRIGDRVRIENGQIFRV